MKFGKIDPIIGKTFNGRMTGKDEALPIENCRDVVVRGCKLSNAPALMLVQDCMNARVTGCEFHRPLGPADPKGQCLQFIRPRGIIVVEGCVFYGSKWAEDLLNIYSDVPVKCTVVVQDCKFYGGGVSGSSTSICTDGPFCPPVTIVNCEINGARVAIQLGGGSGHQVGLIRPTKKGEKNKFLPNTINRCKHHIEVQSYYDEAYVKDSWIHPGAARFNIGDKAARIHVVK